jgi:hypothetical protein
MALKALTYPDTVVIPGFTMGVDVTEGLAYTPDANGTLTVAGATDYFLVFPKRKALSGDKLSVLFTGAPIATLGVGGATFGQPLKMGAGGLYIVGTPGTDHITAYATQTGIEGASISIAKFA